MQIEPCEECGETDPEYGVKLREDGKPRCDECQEMHEEAIAATEEFIR